MRGPISGQTPESEYGRWKNFAKLEKKKKTDAMCIFNDESDCPDLS